MSGPQDFVVAAKNAARDILTDEARRRQACRPGSEPAARCRAAAAVALQHLARTVDLILRIASARATAPMTAAEVLERRAAARTTHEILDEEQIPYRPGVD